jgi:hypothetical protein
MRKVLKKKEESLSRDVCSRRTELSLDLFSLSCDISTLGVPLLLGNHKALSRDEFFSMSDRDSSRSRVYDDAKKKNTLFLWMSGQEKTRNPNSTLLKGNSRFFGGHQKKHKKTHIKPEKSQSHTIEIWLILPVVICLFQGLSHACLRITVSNRNLRMAHYIRRNLPQKLCGFPHHWITWRNAKLIHEPKGASNDSGGWLA